MQKESPKILTVGPLLVTAAVIEDNGQTLIAQRRQNDRIEANKWEFPGGKIEFGETPEASLAREIKEELNLNIEVGSLIGLSSHVYEDEARSVQVILLFYRCRLLEARAGLKHLAVQDTRWITENEVGQFVFAKADIPILQEVFRIVSHSKIG